MAAAALANSGVWVDKQIYADAEKRYYEHLAKGGVACSFTSSLASEVAKARQHIKTSLECVDSIANIALSGDTNQRLVTLENENKILKNTILKMNDVIDSLTERVQSLEIKCKTCPPPPLSNCTQQKPAKKESVSKDDDDVDLFGSESDEEDEDAKKIREQRLSEYAAKKSKKPVLIAKSNIILDVKPWDDETDMKKMEKAVRGITSDGLVWGASKLVPLAYGIYKLQISCVVEDDKVSIDWLTETIEGMEDYVQSVDIAAFNKV